MTARDTLVALLGEDRADEAIEKAAREWRPHLWADFADRLSQLSWFTRDQAEASADCKRREACEDAAVMLAAVLPDLLAPEVRTPIRG